MVEAWNTILFQKFVRFKHLLIDGLSQHSNAALERCDFRSGQRVLDIGCGFGDSTTRIAKSVGPEGEAVGADCAENFIKAAEEDARAEGVTNAKFFTVDAQWDDLRGPYDHAFARFGTMFFEMPGAAMRNVRESLKPGGTFTQIVWRRREENPWLHEAELRVREIVPGHRPCGIRPGALRTGAVFDVGPGHGEPHAQGRRLQAHQLRAL